MRTTVTLDDDVAAKLKAEVRRTGKPFKTVLSSRGTLEGSGRACRSTTSLNSSSWWRVPNPDDDARRQRAAVCVPSRAPQHERCGAWVLHRAQVSGPLVTDAALAARATEHGATLCTTDRDFARFQELRTFNPLDDRRLPTAGSPGAARVGCGLTIAAARLLRPDADIERTPA